MKAARRVRFASVILLPVLWGILACAEGPTVEAVAVVIRTTGVDLDSDGYIVSVGQDSVTAGGHDSLVYTGLSTGEHVVALSGVAPNCEVDPPSPQRVSVGRGSTVVVEYVVDCRRMGPCYSTSGRRIACRWTIS